MKLCSIQIMRQIKKVKKTSPDLLIFRIRYFQTETLSSEKLQRKLRNKLIRFDVLKFDKRR